ncbi:MAG: hypothetical protein IJY31_05630 [Muribaculaceae bacterium]|nr:hypothetical protein [Muribaculaceae bacterium]
MKRIIINTIMTLCAITTSAQDFDYGLIPTSCSLTDTVCEPINTVTFTFDEEVTCTMAEFTHAYIYCDGEEVALGNASHSFFSDEDRDKTKAVLDISPTFTPVKGKSYQLHVEPEVFMTMDEEVTKWNEDIYIDFVGGDASGVEEVEAGNVSVASANGRLTVTGISAGTRIAVFSDDGKMVGSMVAGGASATMELPGKGVYIVTVDGRPYKLINRP